MGSKEHSLETSVLEPLLLLLAVTLRVLSWSYRRLSCQVFFPF